jgi:heme A synthase
VSSRDRGLCRPLPTTPSNDTGAVVVVDVVVLVCAVGVTDVVDGVDCVAVLVTGVDAVLITVVTVVEPHDARRRSAPAASSHRPITPGSYAARTSMSSSALFLLS